MSAGFINITTSQGGDINYYLRENECTSFKHSHDGLSKSQILERWKQISDDEKLGNKELGIRGRHDAQIRKNYTLSLPNSLPDKVCIERLESVLKSTPIKNCTYTVCIHKGEKDGITNKHAHVIVNERNLDTMKKDRAMIKKAFLEKEFRPAYQAAFSKEFEQGKSLITRERISPALYNSDKEFAKGTIKEFEQVAHKEQEIQKSGFLKTLMDLGEAMKEREEKKQQEQLQKEQQKEQQEQQKKEQLQQKQRGWDRGI